MVNRIRSNRKFRKFNKWLLSWSINNWFFFYNRHTDEYVIIVFNSQILINSKFIIINNKVCMTKTEVFNEILQLKFDFSCVGS